MYTIYYEYFPELFSTILVYPYYIDTNTFKTYFKAYFRQYNKVLISYYCPYYFSALLGL